MAVYYSGDSKTDELIKISPIFRFKFPPDRDVPEGSLHRTYARDEIRRRETGQRILVGPTWGHDFEELKSVRSLVARVEEAGAADALRDEIAQVGEWDSAVGQRYVLTDTVARDLVAGRRAEAARSMR